MTDESLAPSTVDAKASRTHASMAFMDSSNSIQVPLADGKVVALDPTLSPSTIAGFSATAKEEVKNQLVKLQEQLALFMSKLK